MYVQWDLTYIIALAICSKNDLNIVNEVFEKNNNMVLKKEDFVYIYANWNPKAENINEIAKHTAF